MAISRDQRIREALARGPVPPEDVSGYGIVAPLPGLLQTPLRRECIHLGLRVEGQPCGSLLYHCNKFGEITTRFTRCKEATRHCATCSSFEIPENIDQRHEREITQFLSMLPPYPQDKYSGRGVVIVGGGTYWACAYVTVRMLRRVGCDLPIQLWYLGERERDTRYMDLLVPYGVECVDAQAHPLAGLTRSGIRGFPGHAPFEVKSFAVMHSPFEEVLLLDSDNYPCSNPQVIFDEHRYMSTGGVFWPDGANTTSMTKWYQWYVPQFGPNCGWETGQYVIHKQTAWRQLNAARWYDDHGDWCYGGAAHHDHGDKGPWRVGWARFRTEPAFYAYHVVWRNVAFIQVGPDGRTPMFIHRCRDKLRLQNHGYVSTPQNSHNARHGLPMETEAFEYLGELGELLK